MTAFNYFVETAFNLFILIVIGFIVGYRVVCNKAQDLLGKYGVRLKESSFRNSSSEIVMRLGRMRSDPRLSEEDAKRARFYYGYLTWGFGIVFAFVWIVVIIIMIFVLHK